MKKYISPVAKSIVLDYEGFVAGSGEGGLEDGSSLCNEVVEGGTSNDYSNRRGGIWGNTEW